MSDQIFISYRRNDAAYVTGHINDLLRSEFGDSSVFTDVDNIALGVDFRAVIDETVSQCQVFLAVIGSEWLNARDQDGKQRLEDPGDFVRIEIESALKRNIPVIPLLVSGAKMPLAEELPNSIRDLAYRNGTPIRPAPDFSADMARLIRNLRNHFDKVKTSSARTEPAFDDSAASVAARDAGSEQEKSPGIRINVAADERARKRAELGIDQQRKRRWAAPLWALAIVLGAVGGWYYTEQNPDALQGIVAAIQPTTPASGDSPEPSPAADATAIGPPAELAPPAAVDADTATAAQSMREVATATTDDSVAIDEINVTPEGTVETESPADGASDIADREAAASPESGLTVSEESSAAPDAATESVRAAEPAAMTNNEAPANVEDASGEVTMTPGSQRQSDASALISEGVRLAGVGDHEGAIENFSEALALEVETAFVFKQRGASYQALGQHDAAIADYGQAIEANSEDLISYYNRGVAYMALNDYAAAIDDFDVVIQLDPEFVDAYSRRADAHEATGNAAAATRDRAVVQVFQSNQSN